MCIIIAKPINVSLPSKEILQNCFLNNPDGAGLMYSHGGNVHIIKGLMKIENLLSEIELIKLKFDIDKISMIIHFRIGTQGKNNMENTHPFPITEHIEKITSNRIKCNVGVAHNGIISLTHNYYESEHSDTVLFVRDYLSCLINTPKFYKNTKMVRIIEKLANSKLAFLSNDGHITTMGIFINNEGVLYSNSTYNFSKTNYAYGYDNYTNDYENAYGYVYNKGEDKSIKIEKIKDCKITQIGSVYSHVFNGYDYLYPIKNNNMQTLLNRRNEQIKIEEGDNSYYVGTEGDIYGYSSAYKKYYLISELKLYDSKQNIVKGIWETGVSKYCVINNILKVDFKVFLKIKGKVKNDI